MDSYDGYTIVQREIAHGGSGVVHEALSPEGARVAIKVLDRDLIERRLKDVLRKRMPDEARLPHRHGGQARDSVRLHDEITKSYELNVERFKDEYSYLAGLEHPNIAKVHGIGFHEDRFYMVSDYIDGVPIVEYARGKKPSEMIPLFTQALEGLDYIHRNGIIHLDVKSANILVCESGGKPIVKIIDFGLAMAPDEYTGGFIGSVPYMAPEVALGRTGNVDAKADLFSMGVVMYAAISWGRFPFPRPSSKDRDTIRRAIEGEDSLEIRPPSHAHASRPDLVPTYLDAIVMRLLAHRPEDRFYGNARAVGNALLTHMPDAFSETAGALGSYLIPEGNIHIGRTEEQRFLYTVLDDLTKRPYRQSRIIAIDGGRGLGKSHLLEKVREASAKDTERLCVHSISLPADDGVCHAFAERVSFAIAENSKPVVVLVDNVDEARPESRRTRDEGRRTKDEGRGTMDEGRGTRDDGRFVLRPTSHVLRNQEITDLLARIARLIYERRTRPDLYAKTVPVLLCVTCDGSILTGGELAKFLGTIPKNISRMKLKPLSYLDVDTYLRSTPALKCLDIPRSRVDAVHKQTSGIPAEIRELLRTVDSQGILFNIEGELLFSLPPRVCDKMPSSTEERLALQYRSCDNSDRRILDLMAVWGHLGMAPPIGFNDLFYFLPQPTLRQRLCNLTGREILVHRMDGDAYEFSNADFFPSLIYRGIDPDETAGWHERILKYLLKTSSVVDRLRSSYRQSSSVCRYDERLTVDDSSRATDGRWTIDDHGIHDLILLHRSHMPPSNDTYRAILALARRRMNEEGDLYTAERLLEHAIGMVPEGNNKLQACFSHLLITAYNHEGRYALAEHVAKSAIESLSSNTANSTWKVKLLTQIAGIYLRMQKFHETRHSIGEAFRLLNNNHSSVHYISLINTAARYIYDIAQLNTEKCHELFKCAAQLYEKGEEMESGLGLNNKVRALNSDTGLVHLALGNYDDAICKLHDKLHHHQEGRHHFGVLQATMALSSAYRLNGKYAEAIALAKQAIELAGKTYQGRWLQFAHQILAYTYHDMDRFEDAMAEDDQWFTSSSVMEDAKVHEKTAISVWNHKGHCYKELRRFDNAIMCFQTVLNSKPDPFSQMYAHEGMGETLFLKGDTDKSEDHLDEALRLIDKMPPKSADSYRFPIVILIAELLIKKKKPEEARSVLVGIKQLSERNKKWAAEYQRLEKKIG